MKIALIADLHGNYTATLAMEKALMNVAPDEIWFLGDAVGKGPESVKTCDWVRSHCTLCVGGNWDYGIGGKEFAGDHYYWNQLGPERMEWLNTLPKEAERTISGIRFRLFHGRPVTELIVAQTPSKEMSACFQTEKGTFGGVIFADSHRPFFRTLSAGYIMNTGSVGNSMGVNRAHALILEGSVDDETPSPLMASILCVPYDNEAAANIARNDPDLPFADAYITEVTTGVYSR